MMSPWLFDILMDGYMKEMKAKVGNVVARLKMRGMGQAVVACLFADDNVLFAESEKKPRRVVDEGRREAVESH